MMGIRKFEVNPSFDSRASCRSTCGKDDLGST